MRLRAYAGVSACVAAGALIKAFNERPNFYCATVYLSQSNACILILTNFALVCVTSFMFGLQRLLYGSLRQLEIEQLSEKAWYAVLDTLLAMPSLRDEVGGWTLATFVLLLAGKVWSWIGEGRVEILEQQPPRNPRMFHLRLATSLLVSILFDMAMFRYCSSSVLENPRPGLIIIFTFEFAILSIFSLSTLCRYILTLMELRITSQQTKARIAERKIEIRQERADAERRAGRDPSSSAFTEDIHIDEDDIEVPGWEEKRQWLLGLDLATDAIKIIIYTAFFAISINFIGFPMHVMRDVYLTVASFTKRLNDYRNYRKTTFDMNNRYPDATAQDLAHENTCIVCREAMVPWSDESQTSANNTQTPTAAAGQVQDQQTAPSSTSAAAQTTSAYRRTMTEWQRAKKLPCGHILHLRCLKAWLERQQACPTCRRSVVPSEPAPTTDANRNDPGANGRPANAPGNNGRDRARRGGVRWINMGPVRIGFGDRLQRRATPIAAAGAAAEAGTPLHPTHSSLMSSAGLRLSHRGEMTTQEQLRALELRLVRQAHSLRLEQAQLATVRLMELELERLRGLQAANLSGSPATPSLTRHPSPNPGDRSATGFAPQLQVPQSTHVLQAQSGQQPLGPAHADLPAGVTIPEGWTFLPLARLPGQPVNVAQFSSALLPTQQMFLSPSGGPIVRTSSQAPAPPPPPPPPADSIADTVPAVNTETDVTSSERPAAEVNQFAVSHPATQATQPWVQDDRDSASSGTQHVSNANQGNGAPVPSTSEVHSNASPAVDHANTSTGTSKGKGKAVELEDVLDAQQ